MKEKIETLKSAIESIKEDGEDLAAAVDRLKENLPGEGDYPGEASLHRTISETVDEIEKRKEEETGGESFLSKKWEALGEEVDKWEKEHPGLTLVIGDIARALANCGL